jgi:hypothetical protein
MASTSPSISPSESSSVSPSTSISPSSSPSLSPSISASHSPSSSHSISPSASPSLIVADHGVTEIALTQSGTSMGGSDATGTANIELSSSSTGFAGTIGVGETLIEFNTYGVVGINFLTEIELSQSGTSIAGLDAICDVATIEIRTSGVSFSTIDGVGQTGIEIETSGLSTYTIIGTGNTVLNIISSGSSLCGVVGVGSNSINIDNDGTGMIGAVGVGSSRILLHGSGTSTLILVPTDNTCVVINTQTGAVSEYENYDFNSLCGDFFGKAIGCRSDGIYELDGLDDDGTQIDSIIKWGFIDPSVPNKSVLDEGFIVGDGTGKVKVTTICDEKESCEAVLPYIAVHRENRVKLAKGFKGRLYEVQIENVDGSSFEFNSYRIIAREINRPR